MIGRHAAGDRTGRRSLTGARQLRQVRNALAVMVALCCVIAVSGCDLADTSADGKPLIILVSKGFQQQYWQSVRKGAQAEAERDGAKVVFQGPANESEVEEQIQMLTNAIGRRPDAIGLAALDSVAAQPLMQRAKRSDIPVVAFDSGVDSSVPVTTVATDNKAAAAAAAKHVARRIHGHGKVGVIIHDETSKSGTDRRDGFVQWMKKHAPDVKLLPVQYGGGDQLKSAEIAKSIITAHPDLKAIYGSNEGTAIGVVNGVQEAGKAGKLTVVGFDSGQGQIDAVRNGTETGAITQDPRAMGARVVKTAMKSMHGEHVPAKIATRYAWYDKQNIDSPKIQSMLYE